MARMKWETGRKSRNVEDRRSVRGPVMAGSGIGLVGILGLAGVVWLLGGNPMDVLQSAAEQQSRQQQQAPSRSAPRFPEEDKLAAFASVVLASTEDTWTRLLGQQYRPAGLVLFTDRVRSACGAQSAAVGPFYCPGDSKVYIDLGFYQELARRHGAPGDFAQAYVLAHEVGHHIQNVTGDERRVRQLQQQRPDQRNALSVALELQADCYAGVWGHHAAGMLEPGDVEEGLRAAAAIGDDRLQQQGRGVVVPESFTHGSSAQRVEALRKGLSSGDPAVCAI